MLWIGAGQRVGNGGGVVGVGATGDFSPSIEDAEVGGFLDGVAEAGGAGTFGKAECETSDAADRRIGHRGVLSGEGKLEQVGDTVGGGVVMGGPACRREPWHPRRRFR